MQREPVTTWMRLMRVFHRLHGNESPVLRAHDLSMAQFDVIAQVGRDEGITQQVLADRLLVTKGNICQLLDRLTQRGLLARQPDGRANRVVLTPVGRAVYAEVVPAQEAQMATLFAPLSADEQAQLRALLRKLERGQDEQNTLSKRNAS
jgi:DNA-binding MarR family transcriptional regulator